MNVTGIIAEYNPFHNGHLYHLEEARRISGADFCIAAISGDFVQRGEPAVFSKYLRAQAALAGGADLVLEIPSLFATGSAEDFAACGVALLSSLGVTDTLCFGSECGSSEPLIKAAEFLAEEPAEFSALLREEIKKGRTWPQARQAALLCLGLPFAADEGLLQSPNNILGLEYAKAILRQKSPLKLLSIPRRGKGYHEEGLEEGMASATGIRKELAACLKSQDGPKPGEGGAWSGLWNPALASQVPSSALALYRQAGPLFPEDFSALLNYALLKLRQEGLRLEEYEGFSPDLSRRLDSQLLSFAGWEGRIRQLKTRQYTYTRLSRSLCHVLLGFRASQYQEYRSLGYALYGRVLGFRRSAAPLLSAIGKKSSIPLVTKTAGYEKNLGPQAAALLECDFYASHLWQAVYAGRYGTLLPNEFSRPLAVLEDGRPL